MSDLTVSGSSSWLDVAGISVINHGDWGDPEFVYKGWSFNSVDMDVFLTNLKIF